MNDISALRPSASVPTELVARLEAASAGNRHLDYEIRDALNDPHWNLRVPADWTTSLDAALALAERACPALEGADHRLSEVRIQYGDFGCNVYLDRDTFTAEHLFFGSAPTPALAVCIAVLKATTASARGYETAEQRSAPNPPQSAGE